MHMLLGLTLMHDADLVASHSPNLANRQKQASLEHWNTATKMFNRLLAKPIPPAYRDAVWATGIIIGAASFWYVNSEDPEKVWPLKPYEPDDLAWLKLGEGKKLLWRIADPSRPDSIFHKLMRGQHSPCPSVPEWIDSNHTAMRIPQRLKKVFNVTPTSTIHNNVYHLPLLILSRIHNVHLTHTNVISFLYITAFITPELLHLIEIKDPRAVFIIGWWFKLIQGGDVWWMASRARIEGLAVRIWLQREDKVLGLAQALDGLVRGSELIDDSSLGLPPSLWAQSWTTLRQEIPAN
jgi:hypothetical protein